jgi:GNAT superfamily N-acetyltransferase
MERSILVWNARMTCVTYINEGFRHHGIGSSVLKAAEETARSLGIQKIDVSIGWDIHADDFSHASYILNRFFTKHGYERGHFSRERDVERRGYAIYEYRKRLE